ncbi:hypothetical protein ABZ754_01705 [Micromonospora purpureochromogenes]|uniref:hypothetical protein n=1 Tax=Micromonospora purpureochromogenes TaxID=47872 RepID=UPI003408FBCC
MSDPTADEVRRLRAEEKLSVRQIRARTGLGRNRVHELLRGVPPPEWTRRPNAKDGLRAEAVELRGQGWSRAVLEGGLRVSSQGSVQRSRRGGAAEREALSCLASQSAVV